MRRNPHASPIKEKRVSVFQLQTSYKIASSVRSGYIRVSRTTAFCIAKCAVVVQGNDTASVPYIERSEAFCTAIAERLQSQSAP